MFRAQGFGVGLGAQGRYLGGKGLGLGFRV